jgi:hypothetical protein
LIWVLGFTAVLGWLAIGRIRLRRIAAEAWPLDAAGWTDILEEERRYAGVSRRVLLFSSSVVSTPLTWGSRAPVVLLPEDSIDWPEAHRRIVLRHELAHIARDDSFSQLVAGFACAVYWFHPLAWITERRLRAECERACDDSVVSLGTPAAEYAAHLLEVARSARAFGAPGFLSVAMARPSQLEGRLLAVLNESRRRVSLSRGARPVAALLSALILMPLAAFRAVPQTREPKDPIATPAPAASPKKASASPSERPPVLRNQSTSADTTFQLAVPVRSAGTLTLNLKTGGRVTITGWDRSEVAVRATLAGRDWRETVVSLEPSGAGARLESVYIIGGSDQSSSHAFEISVPRKFNVQISSAGGSLSITGVDGDFIGETGGGDIRLRKATGEARLQTGGGDIDVSESHLRGSVSTGGGIVKIQGDSRYLKGDSGSGPVIYTGGVTSISGDGLNTVKVGKDGYSYSTDARHDANSDGKSVFTTSTDDGFGKAGSFGAGGIRMESAGGAISLPSAPAGARVTTGGGPIRIGPSAGEVYASTGGGQIDIGPASGSVAANTGAGNVTIEIIGAGSHSVDATSGLGEVVLVLPPGLDATLDLETAYTDNFGHKTRIVSDLPLQSTETATWDSRQGTPRRYVRARQTVGRGGGVIRVRTVNGNVVLKRAG